MKNFTRGLCLLFTLLTASFLTPALAQSVLNPADPIVNYNKDAPPTEPPFGQIGKWVRTPRVAWNASGYKAYIYKGVVFRLHFPKTYNPTAVDGKKYPMLAFFHGLGEASTIYDNEFHLLHGAKFFSESVANGTFDGYVLAVQSQGFFGATHYQYVTEIINYMITNNKLDPFAITANGLSAGGQATWEFLINHPTYVSAALPMSWTSIGYTNSSVTDQVKFARIWVFQGALDGNPAPSTTYQVKDAIVAAGGHMKVTEYANEEHWTWDRAWLEPDFFPFVKRAYSSNPYPKFGKAEFAPGEPVSTSLGLAPGFAGYEWRRNGTPIAGATSNTIQVNSFGTYDARVNRGGIWSDWSRIPVVVKLKDAFTPIPAKIEAEDYSAMSGVQTENTQDVERGLNVGFIEAGDWMDYGIKVPTAGSYTIKLRLATPNAGNQLQLKTGTGQVLATVNVPNTGGYQTWRTVYVVVNLAAGDQNLRVQSVAGGWNFNWLEFAQGIVNQPPNVDAGPNLEVSMPQPPATTATAGLTGTASDADGIASYRWSKIYGPDPVTFTNMTAAQTTVTGLAQTVFVFRLTVFDNQGGESFDDVQVNVNAATVPVQGTRIEAETWTNMSGIVNEGTGDVGGGQNVAFIDNTDWMEYSYTAPAAGTYAVRFRVATPLAGAQLQIRKPDGTVLATVNIPNTGGFQTYQTVSTNITLPAGTQTLRITSTASPNWNFNWLELNQAAAPNTPPTVGAGADQSITLPVSSVQLSGTASDADGSIAKLRWSHAGGPAAFTFSDSTIAAPTVSGLTQGTYTFRLTATDNGGAVSTDDMTVTVNPSGQTTTTHQAYIATTTTGNQNFGGELGLEFKVLHANGIVISQLGAFDHGGNGITGTQSGGIRVAIFNKSTRTIVPGLDVIIAGAGDAFTGNHRMKNVSPVTLMPGDYMVVAKGYNDNELNGNSGGSAFPVGDLGSGAISYAATPAYGSPAAGFAYPPNPDAGPGNRYLAGTFRYAKGTTGGPAPNTPPTVGAGADQSITLPVSSVQLGGTASDADGSIAKLRWSHAGGPAAFTFSDSTIAAPTVSGLTQGTYTFRLTATDNGGAVSTDDMTVTVNPSGQTTTTHQAYIATTTTGNQNFGGELGLEFKVLHANGIVISQLGAFDHGGNGITGTQSGGIRVAIFNKSTRTIVPGLDVIIAGAGDAFTGNHRMKNVSPVTLMPGDYMVVAKGYNDNELNGNSGGSAFPVGDLGSGAISYAATPAYGSPAAGFAYPPNPDAGPGNRYLAGTFRYAKGTTGGPAPNTPPTVGAGADQSITLPVSSVQLSGTASDADGSIAKLRWSHAGGPAAFTFSDSTIAAPTVSGLTQGTYTFRLTATDNGGAVSTDDMTVTVNPSGQTTTTHQAYIATTTTGNQNFGGELGLEFKVLHANGIVISQLGAFDHGGNGITGTQSGGIRVAIFNKSTRTIVPGLDVIIAGAGDAFTGNHRMKNVSPVTLMPGDYMVVAKGYNANELNGNSLSGPRFPVGDLGGGAISYAATSAYGSAANNFVYPLNPDGAPGNKYLAGTFRYAKVNPAPAAVTSTRASERREKPFSVRSAEREGSIGAFPNPARSAFVLTVSNNYAGTLLVQIVGSNGTVQKTMQLQKNVRGTQQFTLSTLGLRPGKYIVSVTGGEFRKTLALVKL